VPERHDVERALYVVEALVNGEPLRASLGRVELAADDVEAVAAGGLEPAAVAAADVEQALGNTKRSRRQIAKRAVKPWRPPW
jgi:hypothetical protein